MKKFKAGILQFDVRLGGVEENFKTARAGISSLGSRGAEMVVLPEMWSCGFDNENLETHAEKTPEILDELSKIAKKNHIAVAGSMPELSGKMVFNTLYMIDHNGMITENYRKIHLFKPTNEDKYFKRGNRAVSCDSTFGMTGMMICYDLRFPELCRTLSERGAKVVIVTAQWPAIRVEHWDVLLRARAIENQVFIIACNRCGSDPDLAFAGHSQIISPWGDVLVKAGSDYSPIIADIDIDDTEKARMQIPCLNDRVTEAYYN